MNEVAINNVNVPYVEVHNVPVVGLRDIDRVHDRPKGTAKGIFTYNQKHFEKDKDYFVMSKGEYKELAGINMSGPSNQNIYLITESGYLMIVKGLNDDKAWEVHKQLVGTYFKLNKGGNFTPKTFDMESFAQRLEENQMKFQQDMLVSLQRLTNIVLSSVGNKTETIAAIEEIKQEVQEEKSDYDYWLMHINSVVDEVLPNSTFKDDKNGRKILLNRAYSYLNKVYGIVWTQERIDFYHANGRNPLHNLELSYFVEQKSEAYRNILECAIRKYQLGEQEEVVVEEPKKIAPSLDVHTEDELHAVVNFIGEETNNKSKNYCSLYKSLILYLGRKTQIKWDRLEIAYKIKNQISPETRVSKLSLVLSDKKLTKQLFDCVVDWVADSNYSELF